MGEHKWPKEAKPKYKKQPKYNPFGKVREGTETRYPVGNREQRRRFMRHLGFARNMRRRGFNFNG